MASLNDHAPELARFWPGTIQWNCPLARFSTLKVGGPAEALLHVETVRDLTGLLAWLQRNHIDWWVIGRGSNILVADEGLPGVVIILAGDFTGIEELSTGSAPTGPVLIRAGAACHLKRLLRYCRDRGFSGLEFTTGIPGSVGGAVVMNAGVRDREMGDAVRDVTILTADGAITDRRQEELGFSYRQWAGGPGSIVLSAVFALERAPVEDITAACEGYHRQRLAGQPLEAASAGSFFKNPAGAPAGRLIEETGLKGLRSGGAMVSQRHANFIINTGDATAGDIIRLMRVVQEKVYERHGIRLEPEVRLLGVEEQ